MKSRWARQKSMPLANHAGFTLVELLVTISVIGILIAMLLPAVQQIRATAQRTNCSNKIRQLGIGVMSYESAFERFPVGAEYYTGHSWASRVLPLIEQENLQQQINFDLLWNHPDNEVAVTQTLPAFTCPSSWKEYPGFTDYCGISGSWFENKTGNGSRNGVLFPAPKDRGVLFAGITDGTSQTVMIAEGVAVTEINYGYWACGLHCFTHEDGPISNLNGGFKEIASLHPGGAQAAYCDGSTHFLNNLIEPRVVAALCTRNGSELIGSY